MQKLEVAAVVGLAILLSGGMVFMWFESNAQSASHQEYIMQTNARTEDLARQIKELSTEIEAIRGEAAPASASQELGTTKVNRSEVEAVFEEPPALPVGKAVAMPSVRINGSEDAKIESQRATGGPHYGGTGDKAHLGGFVQFDKDGVSPRLWRVMLQKFTVRSFLDVGCGRGISTSWFWLHGAKILCLEGSHDAVERSLLPRDRIVEHDFSRGPYWPDDTYDVAWSVEFLEHVGRPYMHNYMPAFHKAALIMVTHSNWGGWHHVEVHDGEWWDHRMTSQGFVYSERLTNLVRQEATEGRLDPTPNGETFHAQHVWTTMRVYINPPVARLPKHDHLLGEPGCFTDYNQPNEECGGDDKLPERYLPLKGAFEPDDKWLDLVFKDVPKVEPDA
jgi:hypothetical protein